MHSMPGNMNVNSAQFIYLLFKSALLISYEKVNEFYMLLKLNLLAILKPKFVPLIISSQLIGSFINYVCCQAQKWSY